MLHLPSQLLQGRGAGLNLELVQVSPRYCLGQADAVKFRCVDESPSHLGPLYFICQIGQPRASSVIRFLCFFLVIFQVCVTHVHWDRLTLVASGTSNGAWHVVGA